MSLEELLAFCEENGVSITIDSNVSADSIVLTLQRHTDNRQNRLLIQRECCTSATDKKEHFQYVLNHMVEELKAK